MTIKTIIAGVALEDGGQAALGRAVQLAQGHNARLVLVHVLENLFLLEDDIDTWATLASLHEALEENARKQITEMLADLGHTQAEIVIRQGRAHECIEYIARTHKADLLIIGPGRPETLRERLFGSTADRLTRNSAVPVLVARNPANGPYRHIAVALDLSPSSLLALDRALAMAPEAHFNIVHVVELPLTFEQALLEAGTSAAEIKAYRKSKAKAAQGKLTTLLTKKGLERLAPAIQIVEGAPGDVVAGLACRQNYELVVLGAHGRNMFVRALLGSVTRRALHSASQDILVVATA